MSPRRGVQGQKAAPPTNTTGKLAGAGAAGGMVKPKGQHGKGPATGNDDRIKQVIEDYENAKPRDKPKVKENFQNERKELQKRAKSAKGKAKKNMQRQANHWKGALKATTDGKVRSGGPLILFNVPLFERLQKNHFTDPRVPDKT